MKSPFQVNLRFLLMLTLLGALTIPATQYIAGIFPDAKMLMASLLMIGFFLAFLMALVGCTFVGFAGLTIFSIVLSVEDGERQANIFRCLRLAKYGCIALIPLPMCWLLLCLALWLD